MTVRRELSWQAQIPVLPVRIPVLLALYRLLTALDASWGIITTLPISSVWNALKTVRSAMSRQSVWAVFRGSKSMVPHSRANPAEGTTPTVQNVRQHSAWNAEKDFTPTLLPVTPVKPVYQRFQTVCTALTHQAALNVLQATSTRVMQVQHHVVPVPQGVKNAFLLPTVPIVSPLISRTHPYCVNLAPKTSVLSAPVRLSALHASLGIIWTSPHARLVKVH